MFASLPEPSAPTLASLNGETPAYPPPGPSSSGLQSSVPPWFSGTAGSSGDQSGMYAAIPDDTLSATSSDTSSDVGEGIYDESDVERFLCGRGFDVLAILLGQASMATPLRISLQPAASLSVGPTSLKSST